MNGASRQNAGRSASFDEAVLEDPRWEALASGEATPEEIEDLRAWAERSEAAKAAWNAFQPATDEYLDRFTDGVLRDLDARKVADVPKTTREGMILGDKYRLRQVIAQGVLTSIWEGEDIVSGRIVAIKSPANVQQQELQPEIDKSLRREIHFLRRLSHPNIVEILDAGETAGGEPFMVMQRLHGHDLRQLLTDEGRLRPIIAVRIAREIASALVAIHAARIMHCRIQPSSIFLHQSGQGDFNVKLIGFKTCIELVSFAHEEISSSSGSSVSSSGIRYMSPESLLERKNVGE
jgi:serine/threonine-protein kinase